MRPDEHKKKKNALYKKKHGITTNRKDETSEKPPGHKKTEKEKPRTDSREHGQRQLSTRSASSAQSNEDSTSNSGSDEEVTNRSQKATFRRREIVSNWARYEEVIDDGSAPPTQRGEDFNKLLTSSGSSLSQFRFRDEEEWVDGMAQIGQVLAVDTENLASVLECLPVYRLLSLDPLLFSISQIKEQEEVAKLKEEMYLQKRASRQKDTLIEHQPENIDILNDSEPSDIIIDQATVRFTPNSLLDMSLLKDKISSQKYRGDSQQRDNNNTSLEEKTEISDLKSARVNDHSLEKVNSDIKAGDKMEPIKESDEDDLDFLLSLDKPFYTVTTGSIQESKNDVSTDDAAYRNEGTVGAYGNDVSEYEQISSPEETSEITEINKDWNKGSSPTTKDIGDNKQGVSQGDTTEDLEDWLDSMLDS